MTLTNEHLEKPIDDQDPIFDRMLNNLQGNILKGHGRELTANVFLRFGGTADQAKALLHQIALRVTSAKTQLKQAQAYRSQGQTGGEVLFCFLAMSGYTKLGLSNKAPTNADFRAGMATRDLADPPKAAWEPHLVEVDAMILIGNESTKGLDMAVARLVADCEDADVTVAGIEMGRARFNVHGNGIEHFGYVDGRSQPLLLKRDVEAEKADPNGGTSRWDPAFGPLDTVLVPDPGKPGKDAFGSFFVFRKLEQNVQGFKEKEQDLAVELGFARNSDEAELAGALVVGRFEDGTPVIFSRMATGNGGVPNNFNYSADSDGQSCPFQAHIRKTNPRTDLPDGGRKHIMARRGIPYGIRRDDGETRADMPTGGVGLLFMAYQRSLTDQFEFTQKSWANNEGFLRPLVRQGLPPNANRPTGLDPVIGQSANHGADTPQTWRADPHSPEKPFAFAHFVTLKGGEYFFAPSIGFLKSL